MEKDYFCVVFFLSYKYFFYLTFFLFERTDEDESVTKMLYEALVFKYES